MADRATQSPETCIIYGRVSTDEQAKGYSLQTQEASCRRYAAERGYQIVSAFQDAHTGTELDRPGLNAAIDAVNALRPAVVILHDVDRLGREIVVQAIAERDLTRHGARVEYVLGGGSGTPEQELLKVVKMGIATYENRQRVERSRRGKEGRVKAGHPLPGARSAYGYRYISGNHTGEFVPDTEEAPIVEKIFHWCANEGATTYEIARRLCDEGIPTRGDRDPFVARKKNVRHFWHPTTITSILHNETYKGIWYWNKTQRVQRGDKRVQIKRPREEWIGAEVPALINVDTWERAQEQLRLNQMKAKRNAKREYILRGIIFCPSCGRRWIGRTRAEHGYYRCPFTSGVPWNSDCTVRFGLQQESLETAVLEAVKAFLLDPESRRVAVAEERARMDQERASIQDHLEIADRKLTDVQRRLSALLDTALSGGFPAEIIDDKKRELLAEREARLAERDQAMERLARTGAPDIEVAIAELAPEVERAFAMASPDDLRRLLELLRIEVHPIDKQSVRITGLLGDSNGSTVPISCWRRYLAP